MVELPNTREIALTTAIDWLASRTASSIAEKGDHDDYLQFVESCRVYNEAMAAVIASDEERFTAAAMRGDIVAFSKSAVRATLPDRLAGTPQNVLNILVDVTASNDEWARLISDSRRAAREVMARREKEAEARESAWRRIMATGTTLRPYWFPRGEREKCDLLEIDPKLHRGDPYLERSTLKPAATDNVVVDRALFVEWVDRPEAKESNGSTNTAAKRRGRPVGSTTIDWTPFEHEVRRLLQENGPLNPTVGWHQEKLYRKASDAMTTSGIWDNGPSRSEALKHVQSVVDEFDISPSPEGN